MLKNLSREESENARKGRSKGRKEKSKMKKPRLGKPHLSRAAARRPGPSPGRRSRAQPSRRDGTPLSGWPQGRQLRSAAVFLKSMVDPQKKVVQRSPERVNAKTDWQLGEVSGNKHLAQASIRARSFPVVLTRHPIMCSREGEKAIQERPHLYFGSRQGDPHV